VKNAARQISRTGSVRLLADLLADAEREVSRLHTRVDLLETALNRMVCVHENTVADSEGAWPTLDAGCVECTSGTVPDRLNTGLCAYHNAKKLLGQS
jgi:hypothetical protein